MKAISFLLAVFFLVSSCSSYRKVNLEKDEIKLGRKYKIKSGESKFKKVKIIKFDDEQVTVQSNGAISQFNLNEIDEIRVRKFSAIKTVTLHVVGAVGLLALAFASWSGPNISVY